MKANFASSKKAVTGGGRAGVVTSLIRFGSLALNIGHKRTAELGRAVSENDGVACQKNSYKQGTDGPPAGG